MVYGKALRQYERSNINTAGKVELIIMCYDKAILCIRQLKKHIQNFEIETKASKLQLTIDIINELQSSLDFEKGGEIAKGLDSLYSYITKKLILADINKDFDDFEECADILSELKSAWVEISTNKEEKTAPIGNSTGQEIRRLSAQVAA